jgi:hypothetical protein
VDLGLDLLENIRQDVGTLGKLEEAIEEELTQRRGAMKKEVSEMVHLRVNSMLI